MEPEEKALLIKTAQRLDDHMAECTRKHVSVLALIYELRDDVKGGMKAINSKIWAAAVSVITLLLICIGALVKMLVDATNISVAPWP